MPTMSAKCETKPVCPFGVLTMRTVSSLRTVRRVTLSPHTWTAFSGKRSCENGMRTSATQPSGTIFAAESHTPSQLGSSPMSL